jgi:hypothetical protein
VCVIALDYVIKKLPAAATFLSLLFPLGALLLLTAFESRGQELPA